MYDVIIVGGGPAGLSAALILGRCLRRVLLLDNGRPRNSVAHALNGYLTRDGIPPHEFINLARDEIKKYETVTILDAEVSAAKKQKESFEVTLTNGTHFQSKKLLIATGVIDDVPKIEGIEEFYGKSVHTCPYCDAWEVRDKQIGVYGKGQRGYKLSLTMKTWSKDVVLFTNGPSGLGQEELDSLERNGVKIKEERIKALSGENGWLKYVCLHGGEVIPRDALFFNTDSYLRSSLLQDLGCPFSESEGVNTGEYERTDVPGLYVAGNILRDVQLVIVAAAEGAQAAFGINSALAKEGRL